MKKITTLRKMLLLLLCAIPIMLATGCGNEYDGSVARISGYTTAVPRDVTTPARARYIGFNIESLDDRIGYTIGYAVIENGIRTDNILYQFNPTTMAEFISIDCAFIISGNFFGEQIAIQHMQSGEGWSHVSDTFILEMPELSGYTVLTRPVDFSAGVRQGDDLIIAAAIGMGENEILRPLTIEFFDQFRTINDALLDQNLVGRPFLLFFYIAAEN